MTEILHDRIRDLLMLRDIEWEERKMMGGVTFMIDGKMCMGTFRDGLLCRVGPEVKEALLTLEHTARMHQRGREMKAYVHLLPEGFQTDDQLSYWVDKCLTYNPKATASTRIRKS